MLLSSNAALPHDGHPPTQFARRLLVFDVTIPISIELRLPEFGIELGRARLAAGMLVSGAAITRLPGTQIPRRRD